VCFFSRFATFCCWLGGLRQESMESFILEARTLCF
jgi:hypothetical protein